MVKSGGNVVSARVTSSTSGAGTEVGTSATTLSAPPDTFDQAPANVLGRGVAASPLAIASSWRLAAAIASVSSTVIGASPLGLAPSWARYAIRIDGFCAIRRYITGCV